MTKKVTKDDWRFKDKLREIIKKNIETEPYEGDTVDKEGIVEDLIELLTSKEYSVLNHKKD